MDYVQVRLIKDREMASDTVVDTPYKVINFLKDDLIDYDREVVGVITLNAKLKPINVSITSVGTIGSCVCSPTEIFKTALLSNARNIIMFHNHLTDSANPSKEDVKTTRCIIECGKLMGIPLLDHIIFTTNGETNSIKTLNPELWEGK